MSARMADSAVASVRLRVAVEETVDLLFQGSAAGADEIDGGADWSNATKE
ncbi:hypothetical protein PtrV1_12129 [Pyrenophora tritici-repentis]|uniref:Uncharacterized protein n=1 Tax=Pyrenophora tritici-repentis TaxID=45151 RepID=A0A5M9KXK7_9PLEO|nr:hypothetical protein PtrV1_12129 [Pyrenophora tritici-repentis]KAF7564412.1 hypothetical protein PtrM4_038460 [Pyrenophora tritici-repentis]